MNDRVEKEVMLVEETSEEASLAEEERLVQRAMQGDVRAFEALYEACIDLVYGYIYRRVENVFEAESLTSETFTRAIQMLAHRRYDWMGKPFKAWLLGIASKILQERIRALRNTPMIVDLGGISELNEPASEEDDVLDAIVQQEESTALWQMVEELLPMERSIIILRHVYALSYAQIAERMGRSEVACKQLHYRVLQKLKRKVQETDLWDEGRGGSRKYK